MLIQTHFQMQNIRRYVNESGKGTEVAKLQSQNKYLEQKADTYCQRLKDLAEVVSKSELDRLLMRYGVRDILELPPQENGIGNHVANINGSNTPDLGKYLQKSSSLNEISNGCILYSVHQSKQL